MLIRLTSPSAFALFNTITTRLGRSFACLAISSAVQDVAALPGASDRLWMAYPTLNFGVPGGPKSKYALPAAKLYSVVLAAKTRHPFQG